MFASSVSQEVQIGPRLPHADVIALQEIENIDVLDDLVGKLSTMGVSYPHFWIGKGSDNKTGQDVALLSKFPNQGEVIRSYPNEREIYELEMDPGKEKDTGLSKALKVDLAVHGETISVFVFHLKSQLGGDVSDHQRYAQSALVRRVTLPLLQQHTNVIVMGDLNADRASRTLMRLRGREDVYADLTQTVYHEAFKGKKWTHEFDGRNQQLDHILVSSSLRKKIVSGKVIDSHGKESSDHFPIVVTLDL
ncbi:MAG: hypothetical protein C9356_09270 [Oleiphilus sp.]|nr:MAG: hypothetical protein C9356_09270 [Oleiphilus sp.]